MSIRKGVAAAPMDSPGSTDFRSKIALFRSLEDEAICAGLSKEEWLERKHLNISKSLLQKRDSRLALREHHKELSAYEEEQIQKLEQEQRDIEMVMAMLEQERKVEENERRKRDEEAERMTMEFLAREREQQEAEARIVADRATKDSEAAVQALLAQERAREQQVRDAQIRASERVARGLDESQAAASAPPRGGTIARAPSSRAPPRSHMRYPDTSFSGLAAESATEAATEEEYGFHTVSPAPPPAGDDSMAEQLARSLSQADKLRSKMSKVHARGPADRQKQLADDELLARSLAGDHEHDAEIARRLQQMELAQYRAENPPSASKISARTADPSPPAKAAAPPRPSRPPATDPDAPCLPGAQHTPRTRAMQSLEAEAAAELQRPPRPAGRGTTVPVTLL